ncbi:MAG: metallophosphoesterase [Clostridia bacterium]|nr:metallophosphoesterase [Clostridia bacterium]
MPKKSISKTQKTILATVALVAAGALAITALDARLKTVSYQISDARITAPIRIALVTDLHSDRYGKGQNELLTAIHEGKPDLILLGGDMFDDSKDTEPTEQLLKALAQKYPCYFVTGNNELTSPDPAALLQKVSAMGITVLDNCCEQVTVQGQTVNLCGIGDPYFESGDGGNWDSVEELFGMLRERTKKALQALPQQDDSDTYTILLAHRPELIEEYLPFSFDLILCGHTHGGQFRIPGICDGIYAPFQGLFPKYTGGQYQFDGTTMIISRGLTRVSGIVPRVYNRPELVFVTLQPK